MVDSLPNCRRRLKELTRSAKGRSPVIRYEMSPTDQSTKYEFDTKPGRGD